MYRREYLQLRVHSVTRKYLYMYLHAKAIILFAGKRTVIRKYLYMYVNEVIDVVTYSYSCFYAFVDLVY